jgi:ferritin-like metal-binding protein YciE
MKILKDLFLDELADMYDAEQQIVKALPGMAKAATCEKLRGALLAHLKETEGHVTKIEQVFQSFDEKAKRRTCEATAGLLEEGDKIASEFKGSPAINAGLISAAQKVEHHEMAAYGCLHEWAGLLGNRKAAGLLQEILEEEKGANDTLTELARSGNNEEALCGCSDKGSEKPEEIGLGNSRRGVRPVSSDRVPADSVSH